MQRGESKSQDETTWTHQDRLKAGHVYALGKKDIKIRRRGSRETRKGHSQEK